MKLRKQRKLKRGRQRQREGAGVCAWIFKTLSLAKG